MAYDEYNRMLMLLMRFKGINRVERYPSQGVSKSADIVGTSFEAVIRACKRAGVLYWEAFRIRAVEVVALVDIMDLSGISKIARKLSKIIHRIDRIGKLPSKGTLRERRAEVVAISATFDIRYRVLTTRIMRMRRKHRTAKERIFSVHWIHRKGNDRRWTDRDIGLVNGIRVLGCDNIQ